MKVYGNHRGTLLVIAVGDAVVEIEPRLKIEPTTKKMDSQLGAFWANYNNSLTWIITPFG